MVYVGVTSPLLTTSTLPTAQLDTSSLAVSPSRTMSFVFVALVIYSRVLVPAQLTVSARSLLARQRIQLRPFPRGLDGLCLVLL